MVHLLKPACSLMRALPALMLQRSRSITMVHEKAPTATLLTLQKTCDMRGGTTTRPVVSRTSRMS